MEVSARKDERMEFGMKRTKEEKKENGIVKTYKKKQRRNV